ncbi:MAG: hypothetical protein QXD43_05875 [Candidatus Aenigmatarchaeota archaeon]
MTKILVVDETKLAECVGLWLAEGDNKSKLEITITNNCWDIIIYFHFLMKKLFKDIKPRIYVYDSNKYFKKINLDNIRFRYYIDRRAKKTYYIYRIADVKIVKMWHKIIKKIKLKKYLYEHILRGFFAGEGNLKEGSHSNRTIRIAQGKSNNFLEAILKKLGVDFKFSQRERSYVITGRKNWSILAQKRIADLHPIKKSKFWRIFNSYKQWHYPRNFIINNILNYLDEPRSSKQLTYEFNRSQDRIQQVLTRLKKENKVINFRIRSTDYWIKR